MDYELFTTNPEKFYACAHAQNIIMQANGQLLNLKALYMQKLLKTEEVKDQLKFINEQLKTIDVFNEKFQFQDSKVYQPIKTHLEKVRKAIREFAKDLKAEDVVSV